MVARVNAGGGGAGGSRGASGLSRAGPGRSGLARAAQWWGAWAAGVEMRRGRQRHGTAWHGN